MQPVIEKEQARAMINCILSKKLPLAVKSIQLVEEKEHQSQLANKLTVHPSVLNKGSDMRKKLNTFNNTHKTWWIKLTHLSDQEMDALVTAGFFQNALQGII